MMLDAIARRKTELEGELEVTRQAATEQLASERSTADAHRRELRSRVPHELQRVAETQVSQTAAWDTARQEFETRIRELDAIACRKTELEGELATARQERQAAAEQLASERSTADALRRELESRTQELQRVAETHVSQTAAWDTARQEFEARIGELDAIACGRPNSKASWRRRVRSVRPPRSN